MNARYEKKKKKPNNWFFLNLQSSENLCTFWIFGNIALFLGLGGGGGLNFIGFFCSFHNTGSGP